LRGTREGGWTGFIQVAIIPEVIRSMACWAPNPLRSDVDPGERVGGFSPEAAGQPSGDSLRPWPTPSSPRTSWR
jgi:hypothetical protein